MHDPMQRHPGANRVPKKSAGRLNEDQSTAQLDLIAAIGNAEAQARAREGMDRARHGEDVRIASAVEATIRELAASGREFTADDVLPELTSRRSVGAMVNAAARRGEIVCVGATTSTRASRSGGLNRVWRGAS